MIDRTRGNVWQAHILESDLIKVRKTTNVVHHMRDAGKVRVRILAEKQPLVEAKEVTPTLEDAYMWLMGRKEWNQGGQP